MPARAEIFEVVQDASGNAVGGALVSVVVRSTGAAAVVYTDGTASIPITQPLTTDANGRIEGYLDVGAYALTITPPSGVAYVLNYEANQGGLAGGATLVTSLPGSPLDGDSVYYQADSTNGIVWKLRYNASGGTYKWECFGGGWLAAEVTTSEALPVNDTTYQDLATVGPSITIPLAGEYEFLASVDHNSLQGGAGNATHSIASLKIGAAATADVDRMTETGTLNGSLINGQTSESRMFRTVSAASTVCKLQYKQDAVPANPCQFSLRRLRARPRRVG